MLNKRDYKDWTRILFKPNVRLQTLEIEELQNTNRSLFNKSFNTIFKEYQIIDRVPIVVEKVEAYNIINLLSGKIYLNKEEGVFINLPPTRLLLPTIDGEFSINVRVTEEYKEIYDSNFLEDISTYQGWDRLVYKPTIGINIDGYPLFKILISNNKVEEILEYRGAPTPYLVPYNKYEIPRVFSREITQTVGELSDSFISSGFKVIKESNTRFRVNPGIAYINGIRINMLQPRFFEVTEEGFLKISKEGQVYFETSQVNNNINYYYLLDEDNTYLIDTDNSFLLDGDILKSFLFTKGESITLAKITSDEVLYLAKYNNVNPINLIDRLDKVESEILMLSSKYSISDTNKINNSISLVSLDTSSDINHPLFTASFDPFEGSFQNSISNQGTEIVYPIPDIDSNITLDNTTYKLRDRSFNYLLPITSSNGYIPIFTFSPILDIYPKPYLDSIGKGFIEVKGLPLREDYSIYVNNVLKQSGLSSNSQRILQVEIENIKLGDIISIKDADNLVYVSKEVSNEIRLDKASYIEQPFFISQPITVNSIELELRSIDPYTYCEVYIKDEANYLTRVTSNLLTLGKNIIDLPNSLRLLRGNYSLFITSTALCSFEAVQGSNNQILINDSNNLTNSFRTSLSFNLLEENILPTFIEFSIQDSANTIRTNNTNLEYSDLTGWREVTIDTELSSPTNPLNFRFRLDTNKPTINYKDYFIKRELTLDSGIWVSKNFTVPAYTAVRLYVQGTFSRGSIKAYVSSDKSNIWTELNLISEQVVSLTENITNRVYEINNLSNTVLLENEGLRRRVNLSFRIDLNSLESITKITSLGYLLNPQ